jgi:hypothetical protein
MIRLESALEELANTGDLRDALISEDAGQIGV